MSIKIYDNGGETIDRYTVVFLDEPHRYGKKQEYHSISMSSDPAYPTGVCIRGSAVLGKHLGKEIQLYDLPEPCQKVIKGNLE